MSENCTKATGEKRVCSDARRWVDRQLSASPKRAVLSCEGACVKGEVARTAANILTHQLERDSTVRICLGDAATGNSGMLRLVERAPEVIAIEGCPLRCGTEILKRRLPDLPVTAIDASQLYEYDRERYFEVLDMPRPELEQLAHRVADRVRAEVWPAR